MKKISKKQKMLAKVITVLALIPITITAIFYLLYSIALDAINVPSVYRKRKALREKAKKRIEEIKRRARNENI